MASGAYIVTVADSISATSMPINEFVIYRSVHKSPYRQVLVVDDDPNVSGSFAMYHCTMHPTYYLEGLSNVFLESCATARQIITTNRPGCREVV